MVESVSTEINMNDGKKASHSDQDSYNKGFSVIGRFNNCIITISKHLSHHKSSMKIRIGKFKLQQYSEHMDLQAIRTVYESLRVYFEHPRSPILILNDIRLWFYSRAHDDAQDDAQDGAQDGIRITQDRYLHEGHYLLSMTNDNQKSVTLRANYVRSDTTLSIVCCAEEIFLLDIMTPTEVRELDNKILFFFKTDYSTFIFECGLLQWIQSDMSWSFFQYDYNKFTLMDSTEKPIGYLETEHVIKVIIHTTQDALSGEYTRLRVPMTQSVITSADVDTILKPFIKAHYMTDSNHHDGTDEHEQSLSDESAEDDVEEGGGESAEDE